MVLDFAMNPTAKYCVLFAGPIGSGKSPISNYLSFKLNLPVFNNDIIRTEVKEDLLVWDETEYLKRRNERIQELLKLGNSFIYDASIDRTWPDYKDLIKKSGFQTIIISLDFSKEKLTDIYKAKGYTAFEALDKTFTEHQHFLQDFEHDVDSHITDSEFAFRLEYSLQSILAVLSQNSV